ncbi:MAG: butyryl-CoA dehydrogenase [Bacteroidetes bacterium OLB11]|nr:MAG: butyryl-CoA dehydrogenase [Bacteroidetes bacterium OLB11]
MNFSPSEMQLQIANVIKDFAEKNIRPKMMEWDEKQEFPVDVFRKLGELGLMGVLIPEEYGGSGLGYNEYITVVSEIAKVCGSIGLSVAAHNSLCTNHIYKFASEELKKKYLPKLASGQWIGAWGLTEANTGSDSGNMKCVAVRDGDQWIINGTKNWITHGKTGDVAVVLCRTGEPRAKNNITAFAIERGTKGFSAGKKENKLGMRASETTELVFDNCVISDSQRLGEVGDGFKQAMKILDGGRISIAALALGIAKGAFEASIKYSKERIQFDQPIANFQAIQWKLADMATQIEAAELLIYQAADLLMRGERVTKQSAFAKYYASEISVKIATDAVQIFGGYGYTKDFPVEKYYRDSKLCTIGEGTSEIQKLVISRDILS